MATTPAMLPATTSLPISAQKYVTTGVEPSPVVRDVVTVTNQVPRLAYAFIAGFSMWKAWKAYGEWKKKKGAPSPA